MAERAHTPKNPEPGPRRGLLIWLSGADPDSLARSPREGRKFSGLGGVVLTTACMAGVSAGFALHTGVQAPLPVAVVVAVLWGLAIANLDRWLVAAAGRRERWWQNVILLLPRALLAMVIGAVVSTPLVLWIFQREIQAQMTVTQQTQRNDFERKLRTDARFAAIPQLEKDVAALQKVAAGTVTEDVVGRDPDVKRTKQAFDDLDKRYTAARESALCEFDGSCGSKIKGGGPSYRQKVAVVQDLRRQRDAAKQAWEQAQAAAEKKQDQSAGVQQADAKSGLEDKKEQLSRLKDLKTAEEDRYLADSRNDRGLLAQLEALSTITDRNSTLKTAYLTLLLFITAIEILPVLTKFLLNIGPATAYDKILASAERNDVTVAEQRMRFEREQEEEELKARARRQEEIRAETASRETVVQTEIRKRELDRKLSEELRRLSDRPAATAPQARRTLRFPGPRRERGGGEYSQWPAEEYGTRAAAVDEPAAEETSDGTVPRWRFK
ncbi:DUF4407 domain-containing protein [Symbioplanes lichenis]|uniref:DUF4407 domain-containing protein n=1 Tax=Symbioplanes lichenis TaxID=1629072 RepID=UPI0027382B1C|nr:DUF4407 domain-containing protein [Actinoplanes lichenis]